MGADQFLRRMLLIGQDSISPIQKMDAVFDDVLCPRIHALDANLGWVSRGNKDCLWEDCTSTRRDTSS